jgi:deoxyribose-phosphate aldolase
MMGKADMKIIFTCMNPNSKTTDIDDTCEKAKSNKYEMVCVPQWFVGYAKERLADSNVKVATVVGLPNGTSSRHSKFAESKLAVTAGADVILIPVNMGFVNRGDFNSARNDLTDVLVSTKNKVCSIALIEADGLSKETLEKTASVASECGVDGVMVSYATGGKFEADLIALLKKFTEKPGVFGGMSSVGDIEKCKKAGANYIATSIVV